MRKQERHKIPGVQSGVASHTRRMERDRRKRKKKEKPITTEEELAEIILNFEREELFPNNPHDLTATPRREAG